MHLLLVALASADQPGGGPPPNPLSWTTTAEGEPAIAVDGAAGKTISVTLRARLAELKFDWTVPPTVGTEALSIVALEIPEAAFLHAAATDYVTDLLAVVSVDGEARVRTGTLAWPQGREAGPVVWPADELAERAPQGVLNPTLRDARLSPGDRLMPDVSDAVPAREKDLEAARAEVEP